jgi:hypothetical protein
MMPVPELMRRKSKRRTHTFVDVTENGPQMTQAGILQAQHAVMMHTCKMSKVISNKKVPKSLK